MKIYDPTGFSAKNQNREHDVALVLGSLAGKTLGILSNLWPSYETMVVQFRQQLVNEHRVSRVNYYEIPRTRAASDELLQRVASECDAAIVGLGN